MTEAAAQNEQGSAPTETQWVLHWEYIGGRETKSNVIPILFSKEAKEVVQVVISCLELEDYFFNWVAVYDDAIIAAQ